MKKAVLIAPGYDFAGNANVARFTTLLAPPLGILALGSYLDAHGVPVELIDVQMDFGFGLSRNAERVVSQRVARYLRGQADSIAWIGISLLSNSSSGIVVAQEIHAALPDVPIIFGGYFPSGAYRTLLERYPFLSAIVRGDGEATALQISRSLAEGRSFLSDQTPSLAWLNEGEVRTTPVQPVPLDEVPILDFRLLRNSPCYQLIEVMASRGCPFQCNYCLEGNMRSHAVHSTAWVARQLEHLENELLNDRVFFFDPLFGLGREQTLKICQIMRERRFTYGVESRVDVLEANLVPALREAGVETIFLGIESASPATLLRMDKVRSAAKAEDYVRSALELLATCFENDVTPLMSFMLNFPGDTEADYQITLEFVEEVGRIHERVAGRTGIEPGFVTLAFYTKVYEGSPLANCIAKDFPEVVLRPEPFIGERTVLSPSPGLDLSTAQRYQAQIVRQGVYSPLALERWQRYSTFSMEAFLASHPELTDDQGVTTLGDSLRRFSQEFNLASTLLMYHDKSKD